MDEKQQGVFSVFLATLIYGSMGVYARWIGTEYGVFSQNLIRNLIIMCIFGFVIWFKVGWQSIKKDLKWFAIWALFDSTIMIFIFVSFLKLGIGPVYFISIAASILAGYFWGGILFGEKLNSKKLISVTLSVLGLWMIYSFDVTKSLDLIYPVIAGLAIGSWNVFTKKVSGSYSIPQITLISSTVAVFVSIIGMSLLGESIPKISWSFPLAIIIIYAFSQILTLFLVAYGFRRIEAQLGSMIIPLEAIFGSLFGWVVFGEVLGFGAIAGGFLVLCGAILPNLEF
ncbi:MAG: DMT family transporter [Candidatus Altiarchaeota archaeon]|nr:DMT family transporter [Candidatus Altiarchaeota archaeon]